MWRAMEDDAEVVGGEHLVAAPVDAVARRAVRGFGDLVVHPRENVITTIRLLTTLTTRQTSAARFHGKKRRTAAPPRARG